MRLYLIRHADPDYEHDALTPAGRLEADALAQRAAALRPTHLYVSGMGRALATAAPIAAATGLAPIRDVRLNELDWHVDDPRWGRLSAWDVPGEDVRTTSVPSATREFRSHVAAVHAFSDEQLARHGYRREGGRYAVTARSDDRVVVVCHGGLLLTWIPHLLDLPVDRFWCGFWLPPSSVTTIVIEERSETWATPRCTGLGDVSHLAVAGLPTATSGRNGRGHE
jgi:broad specificity phosphatase PhoE